MAKLWGVLKDMYISRQTQNPRHKTPRMATLAMEVLAESREEAQDLVYYDALKRVTESTKDDKISDNTPDVTLGSNEDEHSPLGLPLLPSPPLWESLSRHILALIVKGSKTSVDPEGTLYYTWAGVTTVAVFYNFFTIILRVAFSEVRSEPLFCWILWPADMITDIMYLLDIAMQLRKAYRDDHGIIINDPRKMAVNYYSSTFFIADLLSIFPSETLGFLLSGEHSPVFRISRLFKLHYVLGFFEVSDLRTSKPNRLRAFKLILYLGVAMHWVACAYYMISEYEGLGTNGWVYPEATGKDARLSRKYIKSLYWSILTLTTIGETPEPITNLEHVFTGFMFLLGIFVFAAVVGNVGDVISNMNAQRMDFQIKMDYIKWFMEHHDVPVSVQERTKRWAYYAWSRSHALHEGDAMALLPQRLRAEIAIHVHLATLKKVKIFKDCDEGLLCELVLKLHPQIFSPGDYICRCREIGREMFIINRGKVEIIVPDATTGEQVVVACLSEGNYFGEISLLRLDGGRNRRSADVRSVGYSELLCLSQKDLMEALEEYPDAKTVLESQGRDRLQRTKSEALSIPSSVTTLDKGQEQRLNFVREIKEIRESMLDLRQAVDTKNSGELNDKINELQERVTELCPVTMTTRVAPNKDLNTCEKKSLGNHRSRGFKSRDVVSADSLNQSSVKKETYRHRNDTSNELLARDCELKSRDGSVSQSNSVTSAQRNPYGRLLKRIMKAAQNAATARKNTEKTAVLDQLESTQENQTINQSKDNSLGETCSARPLTRRSKSLLVHKVCLTPKITLHDEIDGECCLQPPRRYSISLPVETKDDGTVQSTYSHRKST